jgi:hypothetical protein
MTLESSSGIDEIDRTYPERDCICADGGTVRIGAIPTPVSSRSANSHFLRNVKKIAMKSGRMIRFGIGKIEKK